MKVRIRNGVSRAADTVGLVCLIFGNVMIHRTGICYLVIFTGGLYDAHLKVDNHEAPTPIRDEGDRMGYITVKIIATFY